MKNRKLVVGSLIGLMLVVVTLGTGCGKKDSNVRESELEQTVGIVASPSEVETGGIMQTDASGDGDREGVVLTPDGVEVGEKEAKHIDDIIEELKKDIALEDGSDGKQVINTEEDGVVVDTPRELTPAEENAKDWEESVRESLGVEEPVVEEESGEEVVVEETEGVYDSDGDLNTREIEGYDEAETEPERIDRTGKVEQTTNQKIANVIDENKGMTLGGNASESMKVGKVYHYFYDDGNKGSVGDFVMCGKLAINIAPALARVGYTVSSSGNKVVVESEGYGSVTITKLNTDSLEVNKMTNSQIERLSGITPFFMYTSSAVGSRGAYSACMTDSQYTNAVEYYKCNYGVYEIKYHSYTRGLIANMLATVSPESSLNEAAE